MTQSPTKPRPTDPADEPAPVEPSNDPAPAATADPTTPADQPLAHDVVLVASTTGPDGLRTLLDVVAAGDLVPAHLVIVTTQDAADLGPALAGHQLPRRLTSVRVTRLPGELSPQRALTGALDNLPDEPGIRYAWLLSGASTPSRGALAALHESARGSRSAAIIAPKVRTAQNPPILLSVGYALTEAGRFVQQPRVGEADQGQFDDRSDVLAVSSVGALIDLEALRESGGYAPRLTAAVDALPADVDLGWRLHRDGQRVLLDSRAIVGIDPAHVGSLGLGEPTAGARRHLRSIAWGAAAPLSRLVRIPAVLGTALAVAVLMLLAKRPRAAGRELVDAAAVLRLGRGLAAARRFRGRSTVSRRAIAQLFVSREDARSAVIDDVIPQRRQRAASSRQDHQLRGPRPQAVVHPAFLAAVTALALTLVQGRALGGSLLGRLGWGVTGGEAFGSVATAGSLWRSATDAWGGAGLGGQTIWSPALALLAGATWVAEHLPFVDPPPAPASATVAAILFLSLPLAALSMYAALALITPRRSVRAFGGIAWVATGLASSVVGQGRVGGAVLLVLLPLAAAALVRALGPRGRSYDAAQAGLALAVIGAFAPVVAAVVAVLGLLLGLVPAWSFRRALFAAVAPALVLAPFVRELAREPVLALGGVGLFDWSGTVPEAWRLALLGVGAGGPGGTDGTGGGESVPQPLADLLPFLAVPLLALALLGVLRGRRRIASVIAIIVAAVALAGAVATSRLVLDTVPIGTTGAGEPIRPWAGSLLLIYALVVVGLAARGLDLLARMGLRWRIARPLATTAGLLTVGVLLVGHGWTGFGSALSTFTDPRPAVAVDHAAGPLAGRSLLITRLTGDEGVEAATAYRLLGADGGLPVRTLPEPVVVSETLDAFVSRLDVGALDVPGEDLPGGAAGVLARHAIGFVALTEDLPAEVERSLDSAEGLRRLPDRSGLRWWRVDSTTSDVPSPARVVLRDGDTGDGVVVPSRHHAQTDTDLDSAGTLEVAEAAPWAQVATVAVDGTVLPAEHTAAGLTYAVPEAGHLTIDLAAPERGWRLFAAVAFLIIAYAALPFGGHTSGRRRDR